MDFPDASQLVGIPVSALGLLILYAGASKLFYQEKFRRSLLLVPHLPMAMAPVTAIAVPIMEILGGAGLLVGSAFGALLTLAILVTTSLVALLAIRGRQRVPCVCFTSSGSAHLSMSTVARNAAFGVIASLPLLTPVDSTRVLVIVCAIALIFLYLSLDAVSKNIAALNSWRPS